MMAEARSKRPPVPTPAQTAVLERIADGEWELSQSMTMDGRTWMQRGGIGRGGEAKNVNAATFHALWKAKWVVSKGRSFPNNLYAITDAGREALARARARRPTTAPAAEDE